MTFVKPMLAAKLPDNKRSKVTYESGYSLEAKHDGMRAIVVIDGDNTEVYSRVGKRYKDHVPHIVDQLSYLPNGTVLDGELMVSSESVEVAGKSIPMPDFNKTMRIMGSNPDVAVEKQSDIKVDFYVFDIISYGDKSYENSTYEQRQDTLQKVVKISENVIVTRPWGQWNEAHLAQLMDAGIEGAILKKNDSVYMPGKRRANTWYKVKITQTADVVVMGFTDANEGKTGRWLGKIGAIRFGAYDTSGELKEIGQCSGMTESERTRWTSIRDSGDFANRVIEIRYNDLVGDGTPRHPQYVTERMDKRPEDCGLEQFNG